MVLEISVFLLFILFTAGHSLSCYECSPSDKSCSDQKLKTCDSGFSKCSSSTAVHQTGGITTLFRSKGCNNNCRSGSLNVGFLRNVVVCCDTDQCNAQHAPDPRTIVPNGNKCYYCDEKSCLNIMSCSGSEDRCITVTPKNLKETEVSSTSRGQRVVKGCYSQHVCNSLVSGPENISCCSGNLCNGAKSVTQSFLFLCCSLLFFILLY
ncbi:hypothetical protein QQF64_018083 [Cirrhinus molitorella]|uniref:UPAR/Ly6 domain-containing protein n=1 Tax=Cirrhinus molitorella TaxID=172907 RepID=A0ABR3LM28_9TELE